MKLTCKVASGLGENTFFLKNMHFVHGPPSRSLATTTTTTTSTTTTTTNTNTNTNTNNDSNQQVMGDA